MLNTLRKDIDRSMKVFLGDVKKNYKFLQSSGILFEGINDFLRRPGKRIRPVLFLISYMGYTKRRKFAYDRLLRCSLAMELLHDFMLAHDDVIDKSDLRRGKPALHRVFNSKMGTPGDDDLGAGLSVVAGDVMFSLAIEAFLSFGEDFVRKEKALLKFTETAAYTGIGEFIDIVDSASGIDGITEEDVFLNYTLKTSKYTFECPLLIGAILAGVPEKEKKRLSQLGIKLGQAFQIQDDVLDMFASEKEIGKSVLSDISEEKKTLLVWRAYNALSRSDKKTFKKTFEKDKKTHGDLIRIRSMIKATGAHGYCLDRASELLREAGDLCSGITMRKKYKVVIEDLLDQVFKKTNSLRESF